jgi:hypothetical protein
MASARSRAKAKVRPEAAALQHHQREKGSPQIRLAKKWPAKPREENRMGLQ